VPGASSTFASGINDAGQIVGSFSNSTGTHGFLDIGGSFIQIDVPGASRTVASGINDAGQIVASTSVSGGTGDPHFTT
jgi:probable HAF family extracellular repeat protein